MIDVLFKVNEAIENYYHKYARRPNTILINENDLNILKHNLSPFSIDKETLKEKAVNDIYGLKVIPIKYGEVQAVEVIEWNIKLAIKY